MVAGSNAAWPAQATAHMPGLEARVRGAAAVMLQREVPEHVNAAVAVAAASAGVPVLQDVGGEDRCSCSGSNPSPGPFPCSTPYSFPNPNPNPNLLTESSFQPAHVAATPVQLLTVLATPTSFGLQLSFKI